jgi:hypothetical protein
MMPVCAYMCIHAVYVYCIHDHDTHAHAHRCFDLENRERALKKQLNVVVTALDNIGRVDSGGASSQFSTQTTSTCSTTSISSRSTATASATSYRSKIEAFRDKPQSFEAHEAVHALGDALKKAKVAVATANAAENTDSNRIANITKDNTALNRCSKGSYNSNAIYGSSTSASSGTYSNSSSRTASVSGHSHTTGASSISASSTIPRSHHDSGTSPNRRNSLDEASLAQWRISSHRGKPDGFASHAPLTPRERTSTSSSGLTPRGQVSSSSSYERKPAPLTPRATASAYERSTTPQKLTTLSLTSATAYGHIGLTGLISPRSPPTSVRTKSYSAYAGFVQD